jgi:hypothetical protein
MSTLPSGPMQIERGPETLPWWQFRERRSRRECPLPRPQQGEMYLQRQGERELTGEVHLVAYWNEPWARITDDGVTAGDLQAQALYCDERPLVACWLSAGLRVFLWPSGQQVTECTREQQ